MKRKLLIQQQASTSTEIELRHINDSVLSSLKMEVFFSSQRLKSDIEAVDFVLTALTQ
jgi:hypothetical protein